MAEFFKGPGFRLTSPANDTSKPADMDNLVTDVAVALFKDGDTCDSSSYFRGNAEFRDGKCLISSPLNI